VTSQQKSNSPPIYFLSLALPFTIHSLSPAAHGSVRPDLLRNSTSALPYAKAEHVSSLRYGGA